MKNKYKTKKRSSLVFLVSFPLYHPLHSSVAIFRGFWRLSLHYINFHELVQKCVSAS